MATRAMHLLCDHFFQTLLQVTAHLVIKDDNVPSIRVAQKLHFKQVRSIMESSWGEPSPSLVFQRDAPHSLRVPAEGLSGAQPSSAVAF